MKTTSIGDTTFQNLLEALGFETRSYSGRGMSGEECLGVTVDGYSARAWSITSSVLEALTSTSDNPCRTPQELRAALEELSVLFGHTRVDNIGRGIIVYWPEEAYS